MKTVLIRVGIDSGYGGNVGPIFEDGSFEYVPIPESSKTNEKRRYNNTEGRSGKYYSYFVDEACRDRLLHFDPEFETFTYGDHLTKSKIFKDLEKGDYLIFYAGLRPYESNSQFKGLFIIGYFVVDGRYQYSDFKNKDILRKIKNNAHIKKEHITRDTVIVQGNSSSSKLLKKAIRISGYGKNHYFASGEFSKIIGKQRGYSLLRSSPRVIEGEFAQNLVQFIEME